MFKKLFMILLSFLMLLAPVSCAAKAFEKEINVVFMYEGELIGYDTVTQFKNIKSPTLSDAYIPDGYKFYGWTAYDPNTVHPTQSDFSTKYVGAGKMVHYGDVCDHVDNSTVIMNALMVDKAEIPVVYHYVVIAWYDKVATSGLDQNLMDTFQERLFTYLRSQNVSEEDIATIVIRGYTGNVGTSCGQIMEDEDVDIMLGWGSSSNVIGTGGMKESMLKETVTPYVIGSHAARTIHRLTDKETAIFVCEWLKSDECRAIFAGE